MTVCREQPPGDVPALSTTVPPAGAAPQSRPIPIVSGPACDEFGSAKDESVGRSPGISFTMPALGVSPASVQVAPLFNHSRPGSPAGVLSAPPSAHCTPVHQPRTAEHPPTLLLPGAPPSQPSPERVRRVDSTPVGVSGTPLALPASPGKQPSTWQQSLELLPSTMERWVQIQRGMHTVEPQCTVVVHKSGQHPAARAFVVLVFLLTQGSGKDKVFKLIQNTSALTASLSTDDRVRAQCFLTEDQISRVRKGLRMFKSFSEISKMLSNYEPDRRLRYLMYFGNVSSVLYFLIDHVIGLMEMSFIRASIPVFERVKWWKNLFSLCRLLTAFLVDSWYYSAGTLKIRDASRILEGSPVESPEYADALTEIRAAELHRAQLRRNYAVNATNLALLLSALQVRPFDRVMTQSLVAICGIFTAAMGLYKLVRRVHDNQLTLQFC